MTSCLRKKANGVLDSILRSTERELLYPKRLFGMAVRLETSLWIGKPRILEQGIGPGWHFFVRGADQTIVVLFSIT
jgi:hypothetical protein